MNNNKNLHECAICHKYYNQSNNLTSHIKKYHKITLEEYYLKFINPNDVSLCKHCKIRKRKFKNIVNGYSATCGYKECIIKERENTYQAKTGYKNPSQNPDVKLQKENTTFKHFNVKNPFQLQKVIDHNNLSEIKAIKSQHVRQTCKNRSLARKIEISETLRNARKNKSKEQLVEWNRKISSSLRQRSKEEKENTINKIKETKLRKYNDPNWNNRKKYIKTCEIRYGVSNGGASEEAIEKIKQTKIKNHGNSNYVNCELAAQTNIRRYGVKTPLLLCKNNGKISKLNKRIYKILNDNHIFFISEFQINYLDNSGNIHRRFYDIKFNNNVLLEINGDRVHANPEIYHDPNEIIKMQTYSFMARDKWNDDLAKQKLALQNNYIVIYLWENKIRKMKDEEIFNWIKDNCLNK